jgi:hypothetical protein
VIDLLNNYDFIISYKGNEKNPPELLENAFIVSNYLPSVQKF